MTESDVVRWHSAGLSDLPIGREWLSLAESGRLSSMPAAKRRSEWMLARWTAKQAITYQLDLGLCGADLACVEIRTVMAGVTRGSPQVYISGELVPVEISLTDRADWAVCVLCGAPGVGEIGCDLELVEPRSDAFVRDYLTASEQRIVSEPPFGGSADLVANLIWSAKESALKVLRTGLRRPPRSVEVKFASEAAVSGWRSLAVRAEEGRTFPGWWHQYGPFLLTVVASGEFAPPSAWVDPPALTSAHPSHSWMNPAGGN